MGDSQLVVRRRKLANLGLQPCNRGSKLQECLNTDNSMSGLLKSHDELLNILRRNNHRTIIIRLPGIRFSQFSLVRTIYLILRYT